LEVILKSGARSKNIFWQTSRAVAIGTTAKVEGVLLAKTKIAMNQPATDDIPRDQGTVRN
jgi:hypothetical protein